MIDFPLSHFSLGVSNPQKRIVFTEDFVEGIVEMVEFVFNKKSGSTEKKGKAITLHILEEKFKEVCTLLGIDVPPLRQKGQDLHTWQGVQRRNMPEYQNEEHPVETNPCYKVIFPTNEDREHFNDLLGVRTTPTTRSLWFPYRPSHSLRGLMYVCSEVVVPKYPIYILSKGRWETRYTSKTLEEMNVPYRIVVEPQEYDKYAAVISSEKILILPDEYLNKNQGGIPARNFIWEHSVREGHTAHWVIDDNIEGFFRWNRNKKLPLKSGICFKMIEDYYDRCENVAQCGIQYSSFYPEISLRRPLYIKNTRIYSCILQTNDVELEERWRGKYNEDTDLSLRLLKKGYSTLLFQNFLCGKKATLSVKGGNQEIYSGNGLQLKLDSLISQHPDVVKGTIKFSKVHHQVNYKPFKDNKIIFKDITFPEYPVMVLTKNPEVEVEEDEEDTDTD